MKIALLLAAGLPAFATCDLAKLSAAIDSGDLAAARQILSITPVSPDCPRRPLESGRLLLAEGNIEKAEEAFFEYLSADPNGAEGHFQLARVAMARGQFQQAFNYSSLALSLIPGHEGANILQARLMFLQGRFEEGEALLLGVTRKNHRNAEAHYELGVFYDSRKRFRDAADEFALAVLFEPRDARAWDYLALNLEPLGKIDGAEDAYRKGMAVNSGRLRDQFLEFNYARFLTKRGRTADALMRFEQAVAEAPQVRAVHYEFAKLLLREKRLPQARKEAEMALQIADPAAVILDLQVYYLLQQIYSRSGETELAAKYAELSRVTQIPPRRE